MKTVWIPKKIESGNNFSPAGKRIENALQARGRLAGYKKGWIKAIRDFMGGGPYLQRMERIIIFSLRERRIDHDNLVTGAKAMVDALVKFGWLNDDSPKWVIRRYEQRLRDKKKREEEGTLIIFATDMEPVELEDILKRIEYPMFLPKGNMI